MSCRRGSELFVVVVLGFAHFEGGHDAADDGEDEDDGAGDGVGGGVGGVPVHVHEFGEEQDEEAHCKASGSQSAEEQQEPARR